MMCSDVLEAPAQASFHRGSAGWRNLEVVMASDVEVARAHGNGCDPSCLVMEVWMLASDSFLEMDFLGSCHQLMEPTSCLGAAGNPCDGQNQPSEGCQESHVFNQLLSHKVATGYEH